MPKGGGKVRISLQQLYIQRQASSDPFHCSIIYCCLTNYLVTYSNCHFITLHYLEGLETKELSAGWVLCSARHGLRYSAGGCAGLEDPIKKEQESVGHIGRWGSPGTGGQKTHIVAFPAWQSQGGNPGQPESMFQKTSAEDASFIINEP